ncbi:hypothetical protein OG948_28325 [Embleya sp. NBC_00888]|uniref:hypothetical protein n=1 Tax=Embleya sp. NBC_00888 TaxID=2975960 RepID=UPI00386507C3|nr:hypothetical protein OG948_28325 [Embleya sp. NBC_00888]
MSPRRRRVGPLLAVGASVLVACGGPAHYRAVVSASPAHGSGPCGAAVDHGELPEWARVGLAPGAAPPHVFGARGEIVAVLLGYPYTAPARPGRPSKILWAVRPRPDGTERPSGTLRIEATLVGGSDIVTREVIGGPGPSNIDLPAPGCWHLDLAWSGRTDAVDIPYGSA